MESSPLPKASTRLPRRWYLRDARFLQRLGAAWSLFGACLLSTIVLELTYQPPSIVAAALHCSAWIIGVLSLLLSTAAATYACIRAFEPKFGFPALRSGRDRSLLSQYWFGCFACAFIMLLFASLLPMPWRLAAGLAAMTFGAWLFMRARAAV